MRKTTPILLAAVLVLTAMLGHITGAWVLLIKTLRPSPPSFDMAHAAVSLKDVQTVHIEDDWQGIEQFSPVTTHATLSYYNGAWNGGVTLSVRSDKRVHGQWQTGNVDRDFPCTIPAFVMQRVFQQISRVPLSPDFAPLVSSSLENHPTHVLLFQTSMDTVGLHSETAGRNAAPWHVQMTNGSFLTRSAAPYTALLLLRPYLHQNELAAMKTEAAAQP